MILALWLGAATALLPAPDARPQEKDLYSEAARHLARAMSAQLNVLAVEFVALEMGVEPPKDDAPIVVINDCLRSQIRAFRALVGRDAAKHEEDLRAFLRASLIFDMLRWELGNAKKFESVKESFTEAQWKRITLTFIEQKDATPDAIKSLVKDLLKDAAKAGAALLERLPK